MKVGLYFVFYLAMILELLIFIVDRDDAESELLDVVKMTALKEPPKIFVERTIGAELQRATHVAFRLGGLESRAEKASVKYLVTPVGWRPKNLHEIKDNTKTDTTTGDGSFTWVLRENTDLSFTVKGRVRRGIREGLPPHVEHLIKRFIEGREIQETELDTFTMKPSTVPLRFTINLDAPQSDAITGIPFEKKMFVNVEAESVKLSGVPQEFLQANGNGYITLRWVSPTPGLRTLTIKGDANRGYGNEYDVATVTFSINTSDPRYDVEPSLKAFWDVPYEFNSRLVNVNPASYRIKWQVEAGGQGLESPPFQLSPHSSWATVELVPMFMGTTEVHSLRRVVTVSDAPAPRILWDAKGTMIGADYHLGFQIIDPTQLDIRIVPEVTQPHRGAPTMNPAVFHYPITRGILTLRSPNRGLNVQVRLYITRNQGHWTQDRHIQIP